ELNLLFGPAYSITVNDLDNATFRKREEDILAKGMGRNSYAVMRSRLFFRHLIAYALLQASAAVILHGLDLINGVDLILGGNGWGFLLFGEWKRRDEFLLERSRSIM